MQDNREPDSTTKDVPAEAVEQKDQTNPEILVPTPLLIGTLLVLSQPLPSFDPIKEKKHVNDEPSIDLSKSTSIVKSEPIAPTIPLPPSNFKKYFLRKTLIKTETPINDAHLKQRITEFADIKNSEDKEDLINKLLLHKAQPNGNFTCELCEVNPNVKEKKFFSKPDVVRHLLRAHGRCHEFECSRCIHSFQLKESLINHVSQHHKEDNQTKIEGFFECAKCEHKSKDEHMLRLHVLRKHAKEFGYVCSCCAKCFKTWIAKHEHEKIMQNKSKPKPKYNCEMCDGYFQTKQLLLKHLEADHSLDNIKNDPIVLRNCKRCSKIFMSQKSQSAHEEEHQKEAKRRLLSQYNETTGYPCNICGKFLSSKDHLKKHERVHTGERPYFCPECGKAFALIMTMKIHALSHSGIKPYVCKICKLKYSQRSALMIHWKSKHKGLPPPPPIEIHHYFDQHGNVLARRRSL